MTRPIAGDRGQGASPALIKSLAPGGLYIGAEAPFDAAAAVMVGAPLDTTGTFRPGSRLGPARIREASYGLETYSPELDRGLEDLALCDLGDLALPFGAPAAALAVVRAAAAEISRAGKVPVVLGGEHLLTLGVIEGLLDSGAAADAVVIQIDAHADLRPDYEGELLSHATVMRRVTERVGPDRLVQLGIRSGDRGEMHYARANVRHYPDEVLKPLRRVLPELKGRPLYLSIDIDVLDPAWAPGTGTPEPAGISVHELLQAVRCLGGQQIIGIDLVEVAPVLDPTERTAIAAAKVLRELLLTVF
ncbi:MAG: agmatinase [Thermaerobacterales bacterium]